MTYIGLTLELIAVTALLLLGYAWLLAAERRFLGKGRVVASARHGLSWPLRDVLRALTKADCRPPGRVGLLMPASAALALGSSLGLLGIIPWGELSLGGRVWRPLDLASESLLLFWLIEGLGLLAMALYARALPTPEARAISRRSLARAFVYALGMALALGGPLMLTRSYYLGEMVGAQAVNLPFVVYQPLGGLLCLLAMTLGHRRLPLELPGPGPRLAKDYQLQHAGATLAIWHWSDYVHLLALAALWVTVYLGGSGGPVGTLLTALVVLAVILWLRAGPIEALRARWGRHLAPMLLGLGLLNMLLTAGMLYWGGA